MLSGDTTPGTWRQLDGARLVGICDTDPVRAAAVASEFSTRNFADLDEMLNEVEAVTIAVPTPVHAEVGLRALERGVPVLMEKPLTDTLAAADASSPGLASAACSSRWATSSATTGRCVRRSRTWMDRATSRASDWRPFSRGAPTSRWCST